MRMAVGRAACLVAIAAARVASGAEAEARAGSPAHALTPTEMREDLLFLRDVWARKDESFSAEERRAFDRIVTGAIARVDHLDALSFWMEISRAVALSRNGHTNVDADVPPFPGLPFRAWWFRDGLHVVEAEPAYAQLLGARIERIGSNTPEQALREVAPFISGNGRRIRAVSPQYLRVPALLHALGMAETDAGARLTLRTRDGAIHQVSLPLESPPDASRAGADGWSALIPSDAGQPGRWVHVLDGVAERPWAYAKPADVESRWVDDGRRTLYLRSNQIAGSDGNVLSLEWKLLGLLAAEIVPSRPRAVIVDLRLNSGGNFGNVILFAQALPNVLPPESEVLVLVGPSTFSAALVMAAMLKDAGGSRVRLLGSGMGDDERFWAEGTRIALPHSGLRIKPSWGLQDWGKPCRPVERCFWANVAWGPKRRISLRPDIEIEPSFAEYAAGRDPVLERALELAR